MHHFEIQDPKIRRLFEDWNCDEQDREEFLKLSRAEIAKLTVLALENNVVDMFINYLYRIEEK